MGLWGKLRSAFGGAGGESPGAPASPKDLFAAEVAAAFLRTFPTASIQPRTDAFGLSIKVDGKEHSLFLDNAFAETRDLSPDERAARIQRLVLSSRPPDAGEMTWEEVRPKLAPLLRNPTMFTSIKGGFPADKRPISRPFVPFTIECVGVDSEHGIGYVAPFLIEKWGVQTADVFAAATENGRAYFVDDIAPYDAQAPYPIWHVARDDSYESSRILVPGWLASFAGKVKGRPVAIVPHRGLLVVGGDGDDRCLQRLIATAKGEFEAAPRKISPALYTVDEAGKVVPLVLPPAHPLATDVAIGHVMMAMQEYGVQRQQLQQQLGEDVYVAACTGLQGKDGSVYTYTTWTREVASLLPRADRIAFVLAPGEKDLQVFQVDWQKVVDTVGDCLVAEPGIDPPRWRTKRWPDDVVLSQLRARASTG